MPVSHPTSGTVSFWMSSPPVPQPALAGDLDADVAVVGGGFTGLSTALALRAEGLRVALVEREFAGFGASGRNAGHLTPTIGKDLPTLLRFFGLERARALVALAEAGIACVEGLIQKHGIDCAYVPVGNVVTGLLPAHERRLERAAETALRLGARVEFLPREAVRARGLPAFVTCGIHERCGGVLDPARYVLGLRRAALEAGVQLFEGTPLSRLEEGPRLTLVTPHGRLRAERAVLATNAWTPDLGWLRWRILRVYVSLFATGPLSAEQRARVGWEGGEGLYTAHESLESYRWTTDRRIVGGAKTVRYGFGGRALPDQDAVTFARVERGFRERFPELAELPIARWWSGPIAFALDFLPALGRGGRHRNVYYAAGYAGHGVALASLAGRLVTDLMQGREGPGRALLEGFHPPLPPEPLRWLVARGLIGLLGALDARTDRAARRLRELAGS